MFSESIAVLWCRGGVQTENRQLKLTAQCLDDGETALYRKTMLRSVDLPELADVDALTYDIDDAGVLTAQMPLHVPRRTEPPPGVVPIVTSSDGRRSIRLQFGIGAEFTMDDVQVPQARIPRDRDTDSLDTPTSLHPTRAISSPVSLFSAETTGPILFCAVESTSDDSVVTALSRRVDWLSIDRQRLVACFHRDVE